MSANFVGQFGPNPGPVPGHSNSILASPTTTGSCKLFIACECVRICLIRGTPGLSHAGSSWPAASGPDTVHGWPWPAQGLHMPAPNTSEQHSSYC